MTIQPGSSPKTLIALAVIVCACIAVMGIGAVTLLQSAKLPEFEVPQDIAKILDAAPVPAEPTMIPPAPTEPPATVAPRVAEPAGRKIYVSNACIACHSLSGQRLVGSPLNGLFGQNRVCRGRKITADEKYIELFIIDHDACNIPGLTKNLVPKYGNVIAPDQRKLLVEFIKTLK